MVAYNLENYPRRDAMIRVVYFATTSLSTVGFGDFHPKGDIERMVCAFMLLCGVMMFSYIVGNLINLLSNYKTYVGDFD